MRGAWGREMRPMDCLRESYSFTLYAQVTLEELMPCKVANQIAPVISKHSIWFIRIINTGQEKKRFSWIQDITLWSTREIHTAPYLWLDLVRWPGELDQVNTHLPYLGCILSLFKLASLEMFVTHSGPRQMAASLAILVMCLIFSYLLSDVFGKD